MELDSKQLELHLERLYREESRRVLATLIRLLGDFDLAEVRRDLDTHDALNDRIVKLTRLLERMRDAEMALGSDVMAAALQGYGVLKTVGKGEGVEALKQMLGKRFDNGPRQQPTPPAPPAV